MLNREASDLGTHPRCVPMAGRRRHSLCHRALGATAVASLLLCVGVARQRNSLQSRPFVQCQMMAPSRAWPGVRGKRNQTPIPSHVCRTFGGGGRPGPPAEEPPWLGTAFLAAIVLSFIPGPWQIVLNPIISLINLFYMFKFGLFILAFAAIFGLQWWFDATTQEGQCPNCLSPIRGSKTEPFQCFACGEELELKDDVFVRYVKSGKVDGSAFDQLGDFVKEAASKAKTKKESSSSTSTGPGSSRTKSEKVVDVEILK